MDYLPLFFDLRDVPVTVVGGGVVAQRKAGHLLEAGARVTLVAPQLTSALQDWVAAGRVGHLPQAFTPATLEGARLVIGATDDEAVNEAVSQAARARNLWVNVVDDVARSQFIFPAIIDRSPLIVAVGTAGSSPSLARRVRAQIENLLPARLGLLAALAARWRGRVKQALPGLPQRLAFWEAFLDSPAAARLLAGQAAEAEAEAALEGAVASVAAGEQLGRGEVFLVGVGPGDPDLLTIRAQQCLQRADVLLHDRLVPQAILDRARRDAERVDVGKVVGSHAVTQARINELLLDYARRGLRVARVKGGDPFVFGRGGEELAVLQAAGIPVTVVPGITAALGAASACGIPLTHRGLSQSVTFVTATGANAGTLDWRALAQPGQTVVFYMSALQLGHIVERLRAHGLSPQHPAALVEQATRPGQRRLQATLGSLETVATAAGGLRSPTLLVVGEVTRQPHSDNGQARGESNVDP
ncbi:MAG: hypothetical protein RL026_669 [Pseudomonadota bacterium]|jgi:uroporphyrin-III C-methyltransferase/precorrin-2 dehydrogenase/sirohydrochlorin ferrochelatase